MRSLSWRTGLIVLASGVLLAAMAGIADALLYDVDFGTPPHTVGLPPTVGAGPPPRETVSAIVFGSPTVVTDFGPLVDQPCEFDSFDGQGDQVQLDLNDLPPSTFYTFRCELTIDAMATNGELVFLFDTPTVRSVRFRAAGDVVQTAGGTSTIGAWSPGALIALRIDVDLAADEWEIYLDGMLAHTGTFGGATQINRIRISTNVTPSPPGVSAGVDNIIVSETEPVPDIYYDLDFETPPHTVGLPPVVGAGPPPRETVSAIVFGSPTVVSSFGPLVDQPCRFDSYDGQGDQIQLTLSDLPPSTFYHTRLRLALDPMESGGDFAVIFDAPSVRTVRFRSSGEVAQTAVGTSVIGSWTPGVLVTLRIDIDLSLDLWDIHLNGSPVHSGSFGGATAINQVRISTSVIASPPGVRVGIDDVVIASTAGPVAIAESAPPSGYPGWLTARPNPFRDRTSIRYALRDAGPAQLDVFDAAGRRVWRVTLPAGGATEGEVVWSGADGNGRPLPPGVYVLRVTERNGGGAYVVTGKVSIVR